MANLGLFAARTLVGGLFVVHGLPKILGGEGKSLPEPLKKYVGEGLAPHVEHGGLHNFAGALKSMDVPMPHTMALFVAGLEAVGGTFLVFGWFKRPIALLLIADMAVAIWKVHGKNGLVAQGGYEFHLALIAALLEIAFGEPSPKRNKAQADVTDLAK